MSLKYESIFLNVCFAVLLIVPPVLILLMNFAK